MALGFLPDMIVCIVGALAYLVVAGTLGTSVLVLAE